jgi:YbgC/YbaW family acyl-CoA thioester hydrolase
MISVHVEACRHLHRTVSAIKAKGIKAGVVLNPATPLDALDEILPETDYVLLMSVNPGWGGQTFIPQVRAKIAALRERVRRLGLSTLLEVDGGVTRDNIAGLVAAGADLLVAGNSVFGGGDPVAVLSGMTTLRVRYPETDQMGVVHHIHYLVWFEVGRTELMRSAGCSYARMEKDGVWMPVIEATCRYLSPARYDDEVRVHTQLSEVTRVRARFEYRIERVADGKLLATGATRHASTDQRGVPCRMPESVVALLSDGA